MQYSLATPLRIAALLLTALSHLSHGEERKAAPNVVIILADDLGYSDLGCYGGEIQTPHLDSLAAGGLRFTQFYNTARCWPSRGALMTGYYAQQIRRDALPNLGGGGKGVRPDWAKLLPEYLKTAGYRCYHSGKWHIEGPALAAGFDHSYMLNDAGRYFHPRNHLLDDVKLPAVAADSDYYTTTAIAERAIQQLSEHQKSTPAAPFLLYLAFTAPHFPLQAPQADIDLYRGRYQQGWDVMRQERFRRMKEIGLINTPLSEPEPDIGPPYPFPDAIRQLGPGEVNGPIPWESLTEEQRSFQAAKMEIHAAMVDRMDREIGRVLAQLHTMGIWENTLILFLSDNGASAEIMVRDDGHDPTAPPGSAATHLCLGPGFSSACNTPFRRHKTWVHEGGIATPLIAHWPAGISARGELRHDPGHVIDIVPTVLELAGLSVQQFQRAPSAPPFPGASLVPAFTKEGAVVRDSLWWLHEGNRAVRVGDWKLVASRNAPWELYDLAQDRAESHDLASAHPEKVSELEEVWTRQLNEFSDLVRSMPAARSR